jgi:Rad3-related DNA helicase
MLRWSDVLVGDFNHFFDLGAQAWALTMGEPWRVGLLVDEAHNLVERARSMYSAELDPATLAALRKAPPAGLKASLDRLHRFWGTLGRGQAAGQALQNELPDGLTGALQQHGADLAEHLAQHATAPDVRVQAWLFEVLRFVRVAEVFGDHSLVELTREGPPVRGRTPRPRLAIRNLVPAPHLQARWQAAHSATLFSATLSPMDHVVNLLGLPADVARLEVPSPFDPDQLRVRITPHISTRFNDRAASLDDVVTTMVAQYRALPGNYMAYFSSFEYLQQALARLEALHPEIAVWSQSRGMAQADRSAFVARFTEHSQGIGFAVLGGAFGEGIDLPGQRLIGAFIATLGLPQVNPLNEQLRARLQARFGRGYDHAYLFPGLQKVVQAAGRVIRGPGDRGVVVLMDDRFARPEVRSLLPAWWRIEGR